MIVPALAYNGRFKIQRDEEHFSFCKLAVNKLYQNAKVKQVITCHFYLD